METEKIVAVVSTDWHLQQDNIGEIQKLLSQQIALCVKYKCPLFCLGDVFDSRVAQRESVLTAFSDILSACNTAGVDMFCIPGNHDKTLYNSFNSFLTPFKFYPRFHLISDCFNYTPPGTQGMSFLFIPFFDDATWLNVYEKSISNFSNEDKQSIVLLSHIALQGSVNNDGSVVESPIKPSLFNDFAAVYLGHYHTSQAPAHNVFHLPAIRQKNFGEDSVKGFTLLLSDGSVGDFVKGDFKEYVKIELNADHLTKKQLSQLCNDLDSTHAYYRVVVQGDQAQLKGIDENVFLEKGIDFKKNCRDIIQCDNDLCDKFELNTGGLSKSDVKELFMSFCEERGYDSNEGVKHLSAYFK